MYIYIYIYISFEIEKRTESSLRNWKVILACQNMQSARATCLLGRTVPQESDLVDEVVVAK